MRDIKAEDDKKKDSYPRIDVADIEELEKELSTETKLIKEANDFLGENWKMGIYQHLFSRTLNLAKWIS